jgi:2-oxoglutarate ferredoxin oxidoreductase subunit gamma
MGKETEEIIMAGFGGQGILFLGKVLAETGMMTGQNVSWIPAYGPEMRGGTANCSVVISKHEIASPIVTEPDTLIAMNIPSVAKFIDKIRKGGTLIYNSSLIDQKEFPNLVPGKKKDLLEINLAALKKGYDCANSAH